MSDASVNTIDEEAAGSITQETAIPINQAAKHYPGRRPNISTVYRHFNPGCRGVRLETFVVGGRRYTTKEAIQRFIERTTANSPGGDRNPGEHLPRETSRQREAAIRRAERELDAAGIA